MLRVVIFIFLISVGSNWRFALAEEISVFDFSRRGIGDDPQLIWQPVVFEKKKNSTRYVLVRDGESTVLKAIADNSISGLGSQLAIEPATFPILRWKWRIAETNSRSNISSKSGDDFPARVYVLFNFNEDELSFLDRAKLKLARYIYGDQVPSAALCYVWSHKEQKNTQSWNAFTDRVRMIVLRSRTDNVGMWTQEERNILSDFENAFRMPAPEISGVVLSSDSDNTNASSTAWYGDITLHSAN
jgi:hypothetical protein